MIRECLRRYFFAGLLVLLPVVITIWFLGWIVGLMDSLFDFLPSSLHPNSYLPIAIPGLGALFTLALILLLGFLATSVVTRRILTLWDYFLGRIPIFRGVYTAVQKLVESIFSPDQSGRQVVLIEYPRKGIYTVGFATGVAGGELERSGDDRLVNVFVPTTPNPTAGFYLLVPEKDVKTLEMTPEEAFKLIVSGGMIKPGEKPENENSR
ncbi:MAG: hypothetical protein A2W73_10860 [Deltaproteobacteria bacterium RIFCSPLOWO2_12_55_13]|nr:MAG: hypothetical protein A2W73_10860 [Deltaproteobacteria bacterium RIFCSPLOWO2_12_55_13]